MAVGGKRETREEESPARRGIHRACVAEEHDGSVGLDGVHAVADHRSRSELSCAESKVGLALAVIAG